MNLRKAAAAATLAMLMALASFNGVSAEDKVTICHAAGLDGTTQYVTLTIGYPAVYGPAGHFYENGTPQAGHEQDYLGPCLTPSAEPSVAPSVEPSVSPSTTPTSPSRTALPTMPATDMSQSVGDEGPQPEGLLLVALLFGLIMLATNIGDRGKADR